MIGLYDKTYIKSDLFVSINFKILEQSQSGWDKFL